MFGAYLPTPVRRPIGHQQARSPVDVAWKLTWPTIVSSIVAALMILCILLIGALEIASLSKSTLNSVYGNTSSTGAGFWCGLFFLIAAILILMINFTSRTYRMATIALIATIVAACFAIILIGLDSKAVHDRNALGDSISSKSQVLAAQLAFAVFEFVLCLVFIAIYIAVHVSAPRRLRRPPGPPPGYLFY